MTFPREKLTFVTDSLRELELRRLIMNALSEVTSDAGTVTRAQLSSLDIGFETRRLIDQSRGIWNPRDLQATLSVLSTPSGPYDDAALDGSVFRYDYRAGTTDGDNRKLRRAYELSLPIILLRKVGAREFLPLFPVYVIADRFEERHFLLGLDESLRSLSDPSNPTPTERRYISRLTQQRLHQPEFRAKVLLAYDTRCAVCLLKHGRLLDAAHIIGDREDRGDPVVTNGLTLCKIHHASYDSNMLGISPDYTVHVNRDLLEEVDGPMLKHGIQEMDKRPLTIPARRADQPDRERLATRYDEFLAS
ncbi:HNH endonuclease [Aeromicrobium chenweiae]|uniref:Restriction endonuclease n=1 Tax=Aeromicrobium chenweiae TaxID=2079793 RepID=A0A2S0WS34_9ACTN|nr:HNH endonuclease [Aeromicrobium chenweiae]AWB94146.1 restriction endonuclease [Aeromicrobium chenweiae]TGN33671.1 restriction endonuclease [Aeromicrobium chenweiae]